MLDYPIVIACCAFAGAALAVYAVAALFDPYWRRVRARMDGAGGATSRSPNANAAASAPGRVKKGLESLAATRLGNRGSVKRRLAKAGIYEPGAELRLLAARLVLTVGPLVAAAGLAISGYARLDVSLLIGAVAGGVGSLLPSFWLDRAVSRRHLSLQRSLPDFLDVMIVCLDGGLSLQETIRRVGDELRLAHPALATELGMVQRDVELGSTVDQAIRHFAARTEYEGVKTLSTLLRETQRFGTNITEALRSHADVLRSQREDMAEEKAQKASVKILLPTLLLIFPAVFVVLVGPAVIQIKEAFAAK